jgi:uncharacterized protein YfaS (alpha-2-macroglobulin family)
MSFSRFFLVIFSVFSLQLSALSAAAADRGADWRAVEKAEAGRLPKDASAALDRIITSAMTDRAWPEAVKAILQKIQTDASIEDRRGQAAFAIRALEAWCADTPPADASGNARPALPPGMRPLLEAALAKTWWAYYQANRWQLLQRTRTAAAPSDDFLTWDAPRVLAGAARHFEAALAEPAALQRTPIAALEPLLEKGALPDTYRPTLYDFLVHEAIAFHSAGEQGVPKPADRFEPDADSPLLGTLEEFLAWQPGAIGADGADGEVAGDKYQVSRNKATTTAAAAAADAAIDPVLRVVQLYQQLLRFHQTDPAPQLALADADLARLNWAGALLGSSVNAAARKRHAAALLAFDKRWWRTAPGVVAAACAKRAAILERAEPGEARATAARGAAIARRAASAAVAECARIRDRIAAPSLESIRTEHTWAEPWPGITVNYRNLTQIWFHAIPLDWAALVADGHISPRATLGKQFFTDALNLPAAKEWSAGLPATRDSRFRSETLPAPRDLPPGFYLIAASLDARFSGDENHVVCATVWVSNLAIIRTGDGAAGGAVGFVVNATTGEPVAGADVTAFASPDAHSNYEVLSAVKTAADGSFAIPIFPATAAASSSSGTAADDGAARPLTLGGLTLPPLPPMSLPGLAPDSRPRASLLLARAPDGVNAISTDASGRHYRPAQTFSGDNMRCFFFTDRAIYRPGQTIHFKVLAFRADTQTGDYAVAPDIPLTVILDDPNRKEAGRAELRANDFGSASGTFTAPAGRLTGDHILRAENDKNSLAFICIEEYKRPKFEVTLPAPAAAPKLGETIALTGSATAYTGAPVDGAKVSWRVWRATRWPRWCSWFLSFLPNAEIAVGTASTGADGKFTIEFPARPDLKADPKNEPVFHYTVTAEVTDGTGETRTAARTVRVGFTALAVNVSAGEWQTAGAPVEIKISAATLDGVPQAAGGTVSFHPLKQPATVPQPRLTRTPGGGYYMEHNPQPQPEPDDIRGWPEETAAVATLPFTTADGAAGGAATVSASLPAGLYRAIVSARDRFGTPVTARHEIRVLAPGASRYENKEVFRLSAPEWEARPGETFTALWGSGHASARAFVSIEQDGKILRRFWTEPGVTQQKIPLAVTESMRGGVTLRVFQVRDNRLVTVSREIVVPWDNKKLKIEWTRFNSKLVPGGRETWTARITGPGADRAAAEMVAALYDASLDQFGVPLNWPRLSGVFRQNAPSGPQWTGGNALARFADVVKPESPRRPARGGTAREYPHWAFENWRFGTARPLKNRAASARGGSIGGTGGGDVVMLDAFHVEATQDFGYGGGGSVIAGARIRGGDIIVGDNGAGWSYDGLVAGAGAIATSHLGTLFAAAPDLSTVTARKNLQETAFFFPQLLADADGSVRIEFTVPEALTRWKFLGFAHDKELRSAVLTDTAVTAKDLMVQPNPPRFLREGDTVEFTVKLTNMTDAPQSGTARLSFADATTMESVDLFTGEAANVGNPKSQNPSTRQSRVARQFQKNSKSPKNKFQKTESSTQTFTLAANSSQTLSWRITVPDGQGFLTYKAVAATGAVSDGEEGFLPVLSRRRLVTESIALPIRDAGTRTFRFDKLAASAAAHSAFRDPHSAFQHESLTVQMTSNPAWYAVLALPTLMEFPHECSEQLFNRYYANALAAHIVNSDPKIARVFEQWRAADTADASAAGASQATPAPAPASALDSPLLQNEDLKSVLIEETPWLRAATRESEQRRALAAHFDANRTAAQTDSILRTLAERQLADGLWPWFPGGGGSDYITRYLVAGFARLRHFGIPPDPRTDAMIERALAALDARLAERHAKLLAQKNFDPAARHLDPADVFQLYTRSFFTRQIPVPDNARAACDFFAAQTRAHWPELPRQSQGHAALALARSGDSDTALAIVASLRQRAKTDPELGMWWADTDRGWFWWQAPVETQALMIEVFDEVARDTPAVADLQLWLLKQKQTSAWPSTKATADAVYAFLLRGADKLASDALVTVTLGDGSSGTGSGSIGSGGTGPGGTGPGGTGVPPMSENQHGRAARATQPARAIAKAEPGTGYYRERIPGALVTPAMGEKITVTKTDAGPAWGSVTWQYFQAIDKITPHEGTPLTLKKSIWKQTRTDAGPALVPLAAATLNPGDTLVVRLELRTDRDMEFVHLKDQRGSGTEPVNVLSGYRWRNGLGYYESTRDTATHFFIDRLPRGTHVFEYPIRVQLRGEYESGLAEIQCMYAPEYNSHSASTTLTVK